VDGRIRLTEPRFLESKVLVSFGGTTFISERVTARERNIKSIKLGDCRHTIDALSR
jgi:hypothetical protein